MQEEDGSRREKHKGRLKHSFSNDQIKHLTKTEASEPESLLEKHHHRAVNQ